MRKKSLLSYIKNFICKICSDIPFTSDEIALKEVSRR